MALKQFNFSVVSIGLQMSVRINVHSDHCYLGLFLKDYTPVEAILVQFNYFLRRPQQVLSILTQNIKYYNFLLFHVGLNVKRQVLPEHCG